MTILLNKLFLLSLIKVQVRILLIYALPFRLIIILLQMETDIVLPACVAICLLVWWVEDIVKKICKHYFTLYDCMQFPETDYDFYELQKDFALAVTCGVYGFCWSLQLKYWFRVWKINSLKKQYQVSSWHRMKFEISYKGEGEERCHYHHTNISNDNQ